VRAPFAPRDPRAPGHTFHQAPDGSVVETALRDGRVLRVVGRDDGQWSPLAEMRKWLQWLARR
jgi:hypothetical protein